MSVGTSTALALAGLAASSGTQLYGAKKAADAAKKAARTQVDATTRAQGFNQQVYTEQRRLMNPYVQAGQTSLANLQAQQWGTPGQAPRPSGYGLPPAGFGGQPNPQPSLASMGAPEFQMPQPGQAVPRPGMGGAPQGRTPPQGMAQPGGPQGGMVTLRAPDGSIQPVPAHLAEQFIQRGAQRIS